ncbi:hypothetical protein ACHAWO_006577 [Cyclotella atomus]|jgi:hypothetical protein|uniref:peptidylprolyl isomerase n=1 Tax=Cyclotella atomus TaxID=382360 RepID=A0ABD3NLG7_9STRA
MVAPKYSSIVALLLLTIVDAAQAFAHTSIQSRVHLSTEIGAHQLEELYKDTSLPLSRKQSIQHLIFTGLLTAAALPDSSQAKCFDIESCREEGERKIEADLKINPIIKLSNGVRYRVLQPSASYTKVTEGSNIDLIYSISTASGQYMYSKGFGYEKVEFGNKLQSDLGLDSMRVTIGKHQVPIGIEMALMGMGRGERRRVELPPGVGFETSNWSPEPITRRGKTQIEQYKKKLTGFGSQPPFPAETVWDVEVLGIR